jgi:hypothetical protein
MDGRTDITKLIVAVSSFPKALKKFNIKEEYSKSNVSDLTFLQVSVFLCACCILNLCLFVQPDDGLFIKPKHVAV